MIDDCQYLHTSVTQMHSHTEERNRPAQLQVVNWKWTCHIVKMKMEKVTCPTELFMYEYISVEKQSMYDGN